MSYAGCGYPYITHTHQKEKEKQMLDKQIFNDALQAAINGTGLFLVDCRHEASGRIVVELDSPTVMDLEACEKVSRSLHDTLGADLDDYELEVGSAGLTAPFKVRGQWLKNIGNPVEVTTISDSRRLRGILAAASDEGCTLRMQVKEHQPDRKKPVIVEKEILIPYSDVRQARYDLQFK